MISLFTFSATRAKKVTPMVREVTNITAPPLPSYCAFASDEEGAISEWESAIHTKLPAKLRKIAIKAYDIHHKENRGITREDIVNLGYTEGYAKKVLFECHKYRLSSFRWIQAGKIQGIFSVHRNWEVYKKNNLLIQFNSISNL